MSNTYQTWDTFLGKKVKTAVYKDDVRSLFPEKI